LSPHLYRVHGLTLASDIELPELAPQRGPRDRPPDVTVRRGIVARRTDGEPAGVAFATRREHAVELDLPGIGRVRVTNGCEVTVEAAPDADPASLRAVLLGSVMGLLCHQRGLLVLHASAVAIAGEAVAFAGDQGAGKSTLTAHCVSAGARLVADDLLVVSLRPDQRPMAHPGVPGIKLWRDALAELGKSTDGLAPAWARAEKYHVPFAAEAVEAPVPLARICVLADDDAARDGRATRLRGSEAVSNLIAHTYRGEYLGVVDGRPRHLHDCARLAAATEVVRFARSRNPQRVAVTAALIARSRAA